MNTCEKEIFNFTQKIIEEKNNNFYKNDYENIHSERCVEIPWIGLRLAQNEIKTLLDVGFSMASLDYMSLLLYFKRQGVSLEALDIIKPERVKSRYPKEWVDEILSVPITIEDVTKVKFENKKFDAISIISTIEHVGFDKATYDNVKTAFDRKINPKDVVMNRDEKIEEKTFDNLSEALKENGLIFVSVPIGTGGSVLLKDSLGYYTAQWEYEENSWKKITQHSKFELVEEHFFIVDESNKWIEIKSIQDAKNKSSEMKSHAQAVAFCTLKKKAQVKYSEIKNCRICKNNNLINVLSLGEQHLTGVFPKSTSKEPSKGPLDMVFCSECGLLQMKQSYDSREMYGENYGYRSGLNLSMVKHLEHKINALETLANPSAKDLVIDIGSNDATSLKAYNSKCKKVGIDPTGNKFKQYYTEDITLIPDFFTADKFMALFPREKAKIITSIAMFYDLEDPLKFAEDIEKCLDNEGIWHFEQSYMPSMLRTNSYDTICHEHLEFYSFKVVKNLLEQKGLRVIEVVSNAINGGSFAITACKKNAKYKSNTPIINWMLKQEEDMGLDTPKPYRDFEERVFKHRKNLKQLIESLVSDGKTIIGYGASTKGNVLLQFCGLTNKQIPYIAEVNPDKFGSFTPGTNIPIISEKEAREMKPDYFLVLPWHFKNGILEREKEFLANGGKFIFPLPEIEIV